MSDELIASERLELPLLSLEQLDAIADGDATAVAAQLNAAFTPEWVDEVRWLAGFRASVAPDNERSLNLIGKLGFVHTGEQWDPDDGRELVYELEIRPED